MKTEVDVLLLLGFVVATVMCAAGYLTWKDTQRAQLWMLMHGGGGAGGHPEGSGTHTNHTNGGGGGSPPTDGFARVSGSYPSTGSNGRTHSPGGDVPMYEGPRRTDSSDLTQPLIQPQLPGSANDTDCTHDSINEDTGKVVPVVLTWQSINLYVTKPSGEQLHILKGVSGVAGPYPAQSGDSSDRAGAMLAILGPSGGGKTTLLDVLSGRRASGPGCELKGEVRLNGLLVDAATVRSLAGYVLQDDVLPGTMTVYEYYLFSATLKIAPPRGVKVRLGQLAHMKRVWSIVDELGLSKVAHSFIGDAFMRGLSGGEKRRVSIGCELLTRPGLLFLDEPTTGLDSTNAARVVDIMSSLAKSGVTVIMSIHQPRPDIFRLMDRVLLLSGQGQVVFSGPVDDAAPHFAKALGLSPPGPTVSIADYMLDTVIRSSKEQVNTMVDRWNGCSISSKDDAWICSLADAPLLLPTPKFRAPFTDQLLALAGRQLRNTYRHPFLIALNFTATFAAAVSLGFIFFDTGTDTGGIQNRLGSLFFMLLYLSLMSLSSLPIWRDDKLLFMRERDAGLYDAPAYFTAVVLFDLLPLRVIPPTFFALFSYPFIGLHPSCVSCILSFVWNLVVANVTSASMCMAIGAASPSNSVANMVGSLTLMLLLLFGGFLLNKQRVPVYCRWISGTSFFNYAYEALVVNEFHNFPVDFSFTAPLNSSVLPPLRITGDGVLKEFGFESDRLYVDTCVLLLLGLGCGALAYTCLSMSGSNFAERVEHVCAQRVVLLLSKLKEVMGRRGQGGRGGEVEVHGDAMESLPFLEDPMAGVDEDDGAADLAPLTPLSHAPSSALLSFARQGSIDGYDDEEADVETGGLQSAQPGGQGWRPMVLSWDNVSCQIQLPRGKTRYVLQSVMGVAGPTSTLQAMPPSNAPAGLPRADGCDEDNGNGTSAFPHTTVPATTIAATGSCLFAILGPSGAGKTTLLDILTGRRMQGPGSGVVGEVRVDGHLMAAGSLCKVSGYVQQESILPGTSTVAEYLTFHARLRMKSGSSKDAVRARVAHVTADLSLGKVLHSFIGDAFVRGLSGGEKRRVSIGCELLTRPGLLFLDEPTTGLDSTNAARVVDIMSSLAKSGVTVIMSIHQPRPDIFRLMDRVLIMSGQGQVVYTGATEHAVAYFKTMGHAPPPSVPIADHVLDVVIKASVSNVSLLVEAFAASESNADARASIAEFACNDSQQSHSHYLHRMQKYESSYTEQVHALSARLMRNSIRHPLLFLLGFVATAVMALGIGAVYWSTGRDTGGIQDRCGSLFFMLLYLSLMSLSSLPIWRDDTLLFKRERAAGTYGTAAYFTSVVLFDFLPLRVLPPIFFTLTSYWMIGLNPMAGRWLQNLLVLVLTNMCAAAMNMSVGAALPSVAAANMMGSLCVLVCTLFGGFLLSRNKMPGVIGLLARSSYMRYAFEALVISEFHGADGFRFTAFHQPGTRPDQVPYIDVNGDEILSTFGFANNTYLFDVYMLFVLTVFYLITTYLLLGYKGR